jgi:hypothetical protein
MTSSVLDIREPRKGGRQREIGNKWGKRGRLTILQPVENPSEEVLGDLGDEPCIGVLRPRSSFWLRARVGEGVLAVRRAEGEVDVAEWEEDGRAEYQVRLMERSEWKKRTRKIGRTLMFQAAVKRKEKGKKEVVTPWDELDGKVRKVERGKLTSPYGLAMKLGTTPCWIPAVFASSLKRTALSATRRADV